MKIRECSDLHLDHYYDSYDTVTPHAEAELLKLLPVLPTDSSTVLVVAGDLASAYRVSRIVTFMKLVVPRFKHVIYVLGNHDHYGSRFSGTELGIQKFIIDGLTAKEAKKVTIAGNIPVKKKIGNVTFLCGTLWTGMGEGDKKIDAIIATYMNDFRMIYDDAGQVMRPAGFAKTFYETVAQFEDWLAEGDNSKTVVVTHHMPTFRAVDPQYTKDEVSRALNYAFAANLDVFILRNQPAIWFFGHTHTPYEGKLGETLLWCNPAGYPNEKTMRDGAYDSTRIFEL